MPTRRGFLTTGSLIIFLAVQRSLVRVPDSTTHEFGLTITVDRETVYDDMHTVTAEENGSTVELVDELPDERGKVTIETGLGDVDISESTTFDDDNCYDIIVEYTGDNLVHWQSGSGNGCEEFISE